MAFTSEHACLGLHCLCCPYTAVTGIFLVVYQHSPVHVYLEVNLIVCHRAFPWVRVLLQTWAAILCTLELHIHLGVSSIENVYF